MWLTYALAFHGQSASYNTYTPKCPDWLGFCGKNRFSEDLTFERTVTGTLHASIFTQKAFTGMRCERLSDA